METYARQYGYAFSVNEDAEKETEELTLYGGTRLQEFAASFRHLVGRVVSLLGYSQQMQDEYNRYASDANLVGWNTQPDGSGTAYAKDAQVTLNEDTDLYAQWEVPQMSIDGNTYPIDMPCSGNGWEYNTNTLVLNGYNSGDIVIPKAIEISAFGQNTISGQLKLVERKTENYARVEENICVADESMESYNGNSVRGGQGSGQGASSTWIKCSPLWLIVQENSILSIQNRSEEAPAIEALSAVCYVYGTLEINSTSDVGLWAEQSAKLYAWNGFVEIVAAEQALRCGRGYSFGGTAGVYSNVGTGSSGYYGGPYLRMEPVKAPVLTFNANGGQWSDCDGAVREEPYPLRGAFDLSVLRNLISRAGHVLTGWMDANDDHDYPVNGMVSAGDLTLYAQWTAADSFSIGGTSFRADQAASGTGWRFAPAQNEDYAVLTLDSAYAGGEIFTAIPLRIVTDGYVSITAGIGKPGVEALQELDLRVNSGSLTITAGDGCDAMVVQGDVHVTAGGALAAKGGAGGLAIRSIGSVLLTGSNQITLTGGQNACAVWADEDVDIRNTGDTYLMGSGWCAVSSGNLLLSG